MHYECHNDWIIGAGGTGATDSLHKAVKQFHGSQDVPVNDTKWQRQGAQSEGAEGFLWSEKVTVEEVPVVRESTHCPQVTPLVAPLNSQCAITVYILSCYLFEHYTILIELLLLLLLFT